MESGNEGGRWLETAVPSRQDWRSGSSMLSESSQEKNFETPRKSGKRLRRWGGAALLVASIGLLAQAGTLSTQEAWAAAPTSSPSITVDIRKVDGTPASGQYEVAVTNATDSPMASIEGQTTVPQKIRPEDQTEKADWVVGPLLPGETKMAQANGANLALHLVTQGTPDKNDPSDTTPPAEGGTRPGGGADSATSRPDSSGRPLAATGWSGATLLLFAVAVLGTGTGLLYAASRRKKHIRSAGIVATVGVIALAAAGMPAPHASAAPPGTLFETQSKVSIEGMEYVLTSQGSFVQEVKGETELTVVSGRALDATQTPVRQSEVRFTPEGDAETVTVTTDSDGHFSTHVMSGSTYVVTAPGLNAVLTVTKPGERPDVRNVEGSLELGITIEGGAASVTTRSDVFIVEAARVSQEGTTVVTLDERVMVGDLVAALPELESELGTIGRVIDKESVAGGVSLTLEPVEFVEVADALNVTDQVLTPDEALFFPAEGAVVETEPARTRAPVENQRKVVTQTSGSMKAKVTLDVTGSVEVGADVPLFNLAGTSVHLTNSLTVSAKAEMLIAGEADAELQLGTLVFPIHPILAVKVPYSIVAHADGKIDAIAESTALTSTTVRYENATLTKSDETSLESKTVFTAAATLRLGLRFDTTLTLGPVDLVTVRTEPGVQLDAQGQLLIADGGEVKPVDVSGSVKIFAYFKAWWKIPIIAPISEQYGKNFNDFGKNPLIEFLLWQWPEGGQVPNPEETKNTSLTGRVTDSQTNEAVSGAGITVTSLATGAVVATATSGADGNFQTQAPSGRLRVAFTKDGYSPLRRDILVPEGATSAQVDAVMSRTDNVGPGEYRVVLSWGAEPLDLDSHLEGVEPDFSYHVFFGDKIAIREDGSVAAALDRDDVDGHGPETITFRTVPNGTYEYFIHNYSGESPIAGSGARVDLYKNNSRVASYTAPASGDGTVWNVFRIRNGQIFPVNSLEDRDPFPLMMRSVAAKN